MKMSENTESYKAASKPLSANERLTKEDALKLFRATEEMLSTAYHAVSKKLLELEESGKIEARFQQFNVATHQPDFIDDHAAGTRQNPHASLSGPIDIELNKNGFRQRLNFFCLVPGDDGLPGAQELHVKATYRSLHIDDSGNPPRTIETSTRFQEKIHSSLLHPKERLENVVFLLFLEHLQNTLPDKIAQEIIRDVLGIDADTNAIITNHPSLTAATAAPS